MMEIAGKLRSPCSPEELLATLFDADVLVQLLPPGAKVQEIDAGRYSFVVSREFGPVKLTLPGQMTVSVPASGQGRHLSVRAAHIIGGKVDLDLDLAFEPAEDPSQTLLSYSGALQATGLAGRIARDRRDRINLFVRNSMIRLKQLAESRAGHAPAAGNR